ncbi:GPR4 protein, partial [Amia calva]|nr:GPR4 protein [Amia calva]
MSIYSVTFVLALPANLLSLWGLYQLLRAGNTMPIFILNLLVSDLLQILTLPLWIIYLKKNHMWTYGDTICDFVGYLFYINLYASIVFLCLIALDRYLAIVHPLRSRRFRTVKLALVVSLGVWVVIFLFCLSGLYPSVVTKNEIKPNKKSVLNSNANGTFISGCLNTVFYFQTRIHTALRSSPSVSRGERKKIVGILCIITVIFIVVFGPYHLVGSYKFIYYFITIDRCALEKKLFLTYRLCYGLTSLNNLLDPLFYIFICNDIRKQLKKSLPCIRSYLNSVNDSEIHIRNFENITP